MRIFFLFFFYYLLIFFFFAFEVSIVQGGCIIVGGIFEVLVVWLIVASGEGGRHLLSGQWTAE